MIHEYIARIVVGIMSEAHNVLGGWVNVTNVSGNDGPIGISLTVQGQAFFANVAAMNVSAARIAADLFTVIDTAALWVV